MWHKSLLVLWGLALVAGTAVAADELASVGVAKVDITPDTPVLMYGYAARKTESEGISGRLKASALALGTDACEGPAVLLCVDCGAVPAAIRQAVLSGVQAKVPLRPERFMLANAHIHSGPNVKNLDGVEGAEREHLLHYSRQLTEKLTGVVLAALAARVPGRLAWTKGTVGFAANRRVLKNGKWSGFGAVKEGAVDHSLPLLRVTDAQGKLRAVVVNYACHNTTLRGNFRQIHADWAGCAQEAIEADQPGAVAMVTIGCGADADPCPHSTVDLCRQHGRQMADEVKRLLTGKFQPVSGTVKARIMTLAMPYVPLPPIDQLRALAKKSYALARVLKRVEAREKMPATRPFMIATWAFGKELAMVFFSDEVVVDYALRIKREMDGRRLWINAYTGDVSNYVVSNRLIGEGGYEVNNSVSNLISYGRPETVQPPMEDQVVAAVRVLLPDSFRVKSAH